ncbi:MAG TPA: DUF916 domain-containing protein [Candidatus Saccharimonadales bacterium]|nr:DUF916 domain-containing protein [Candidatus Saccharimonadales bacterium]
MKKYLRAATGTLLILVSLFAPLLSPAAARAATAAAPNGFRVSPPRYELTIDRGQSQTVSLFVENLANSAVTAQPIINDFTASSDESGQPALILDPNVKAPEKSFKTLVQTIPNTSIAALERKEIKVTLKVPANATPGGYYGAVRFAPVHGGVTGPSNLSLTASVGTLFLITVPGNLTEKLTAVSFQATKNGNPGSFFNSGPIAVTTRLKNEGNIHVQPFGKIVVKNTFGKTVYTAELNDTQPRGNVLPDSIRKFNNPINVKHLLGKYTVEGNFAYGSNGDIVSVKTTFYVIPYVLIIIILAILLFLIFVLPKLIKAYNRRIIEKAKKH